MSRKKQKKTLEELLEEALVPEEEQPYQVPENWVWVRFEQALENVTDSSRKVKQKDYLSSGSIPVIDQGAEMIGGYTNQEELCHPAPLPVIIFGDHTKCVKWVDFEFAQGADGVKVLKNRKAFDPKFLYYYLTSLKLPDKGYSRHFKYLKQSKIPLPPLPEQKRIVARVESLLGKINEAKELIKEAKETFESRRSAILAKAFRGELTKKWREQHPDIEPADLLLAQGEEDSLKETKKSSKQKIAPPPANFPYELPKGWRWVKFGSCVENHNGKRVPVSGKERENRKGPFPYYGASGVIDSIDGYTHDGEFVLIGEDGANLISRNKPIAFLAKGKIWVNNHAHVVSCRIGILNDYLCHYINSIDLRPYVTGSAQPKLTKKMLNTIPIPLPSKEEQQEIVSLINNVFEAEKLVEENLSSLKSQLNSLTQSILNKAFRGELGTNDPEEESALELLKEVLLEQAGETIDNPKSKANRQGSLLLV